MKIRVKGFFSIKNAKEKKGEIEMEVDNLTIREVLTELSNRYGKKFKDEVFDLQINEVVPQNQILINGRHYRYLANGLDTKLSEGDTRIVDMPIFILYLKCKNPPPALLSEIIY